MPYMILNGDPAKTAEVVSINARKKDTKNKLSKSIGRVRNDSVFFIECPYIVSEPSL